MPLAARIPRTCWSALRPSGRSHGRPSGGAAGQASVELIALLPVLAVLAGILWQGVVAGQAVWLSGTAARAAARADALGQDAQAAARAALPPRLRAGTSAVAAKDDDGGGVRVRIVVPLVLGGTDVGAVTARARLEDQR